MNVLLDTKIRNEYARNWNISGSYLTLILLAEIFALMKIYFFVMNGHHCCATFKNTTTPVPTFPKDQEVHVLHQIHKQRIFFLFPFFISVLLSQPPKNNDPWFYLFPVSGIECPMCTNVPGLGAGKCDSGKVPTVNCSDELDQCMSLKGKMGFPGFTQSIELKNCSNNVLCDSASDHNGTNRNEFSRLLLPSHHVNYASGIVGVSLWCNWIVEILAVG